jgi:hypothetical protein
MVFINHEIKALFLHNPKCAGAFVREILCNKYDFKEITHILHNDYSDFFLDKDKHMIDFNQDTDKHTIRNMGKYRFFYSHQDVDKKVFEDYFSFTFVRNPYEKIYSAYLYLKSQLDNSNFNSKIRNTHENKEYFCDFNTFIKNYENVNNLSYFHAFITQCDQLFTFDNNININYIGKTETLHDDLLKIFSILGNYKIKHFPELLKDMKYNTSDYKNTNISLEYNEESFNFVNSYFKDDFLTFGYEKYDNIIDFRSSYEFNKKSILLDHYKQLNKSIFNKHQDKNGCIENLNLIIGNLFDRILLNNNNHCERSEISELRSDISKMVSVNEVNLLELSYQKLKYTLENYTVSNIVCDKCNFKSFNILSFNAHKQFCKNNNYYQCAIEQSSKCKISNNFNTVIHDEIEATINSWDITIVDDDINNSKIYNEIILNFNNFTCNTLLLDVEKPMFDVYEKFIYEIAMFQFKRLNIEFDSKKHFIEIWHFNKLKPNSNYHLDCDENERKINNLTQCSKPFLSCVTYLNDNNDEPTVLTNMTDDLHKNKNVKDIQICFSFPKKLKHIAFQGGKYFHCGKNISNFNNVLDRNIIVMNLWEKKPLDIKYYNPIATSNKYEKLSKDISLSFTEDNYKKSIYLCDNVFNDSFFTNFLYNSNESANLYSDLRNIILKSKSNSDKLLFNNHFYIPESLNSTLETGIITFKRLYQHIKLGPKFLQRFIIHNKISPSICDWIVSESENYAQNNNGWFTDRHKNYATTDLPVKNILTIVPYFKEFYSSVIDNIKDSYNIDNHHIFSIGDAFIVKYELGTQTYLDMHGDGSSLTINLLLNDKKEFEGGGTYFYDGLTTHLEKGDMLIHCGKSRHCGLEITKGKRYLLVIFINIYNSSIL